MYTFQYDFYPDLKKISFDEYSQEFWSFVSSLSKNGQIVADRLWNIVEHDDRLQFLGITPDEDSLEPKYHNKYCQEYQEKLNELSIMPLRFSLLGRTFGYSRYL